MTEISRRSLLQSGAGVAGTIPVSQARSVAASPRASFIAPSDFGVDATGLRDAHEGLQRAVEISARERLPLILEGVYRLEAPLKIMSNATLNGTGSLRAAHSGALLTSGEKTVARVSIDGIRLEALAATVDRAIDGVQWQYARLNNLRLMTAGGKFRTGFYFTNVAYWNSISAIEAESVETLFDIGDANNLILNDINWCRFSDIGMTSFFRFHAPCSGIYGRGLSAEGVFHNSVLVRLDPECENVDLEFIRVEGRSGSTNTTLIDFNGAQGNCVRLPPIIFGLFGEAVKNERGNFVINLNANGAGASHFGRGEAVAPLADHDPTIEGAFNYNERLGRLRANVSGARGLVVSPALDPLDLNGHPIRGVPALTLKDSAEQATATLSFDASAGALLVEFGDSKTRLFTRSGPAPIVRGSRREGQALAALFRALHDMGFIVDRTTP